MRLGLFMMPVHPPGRSMSDTLREDTAKSLLADQLGFDELWMGEHFSATTEPFPSPLMFLAGLVPQTKNLTFGTAVINLPNHHPAIVAGEVAQFDHMSGGRFMLGIGPGGLASDHELFEVGDGAKRGRMFVEAIDHMIQDLGAGPALRHRRRVLERQDQEGDRARARLRHHAEAAAAAAPADPHFDRQPGFVVGAHGGVARLGHHLGSERADLFDRLALEGLCRNLRRGGRPARGENWRVSRNVIVAPTDAEAEDRVFGADTANRYFFTYMRTAVAKAGRLGTIKPRPDMSDEEFTPDVLMAECAIYGSPKTVLDKLVAFRDARRAVRHGAEDGRRLGRPERGLGARGDAAPGARGDAEIPPARCAANAGGGISLFGKHFLQRGQRLAENFFVQRAGVADEPRRVDGAQLVEQQHGIDAVGTSLPGGMRRSGCGSRAVRR